MQEQTAPAAQTAPANRTHPLLIVLAAASVLGCVALALTGYLQPTVMGIVQGLGEFLPISSSAHLILVPWFFGWQEGMIDTLTFDVALHLGTLVALLAYFWHDWVTLIAALPGYAAWLLGGLRAGWRGPPAPAVRLLHMVVLGTLPGAVLGLLLEQIIEEHLRAPLLIALTLTIMGLLLYLADSRAPARKALDDISWRDALLIGLAQACALIPGVSRSGATLTMGRTLALDRTTAARFSFLLSGPITAAALVLKIPDILTIPPAEIPVFAVGVLVSAAVGALAISFLLSYIRRAGLGIFAVYRVALAAVIILVYVTR